VHYWLIAPLKRSRFRTPKEDSADIATLAEAFREDKETIWM